MHGTGSIPGFQQLSSLSHPGSRNDGVRRRALHRLFLPLSTLAPHAFFCRSLPSPPPFLHHYYIATRSDQDPNTGFPLPGTRSLLGTDCYQAGVQLRAPRPSTPMLAPVHVDSPRPSRTLPAAAVSGPPPKRQFSSRRPSMLHCKRML